MDESNTTEKRIWFLDNLRYLMVLFVVLLHSAMSYMTLAGFWSVSDPMKSELFDILGLFIDVFAMPVLFFIAGYFALVSIRKKDLREFLIAKFKRLGIPCIIGTPFMSWVHLYIYKFTRSNFSLPVDFKNQWQQCLYGMTDLFFIGDPQWTQFHQGHFWFISLLLAFFIVFGVMYHYREKYPIRSIKKTPMPSDGKGILFALIFLGLLTTAGVSISTVILNDNTNHISILDDLGRWVIIGNLLQFEAIRLFGYISYFAMGIYACWKKWFEGNCIPGNLAMWSTSCSILFLFYLILVTIVDNSNIPSLGLLFTLFLTRSILCLNFLIAFLVFSFRYWNRTSPIHAKLAANSYYIYLIHMFFVLIFQTGLAFWYEASEYIKFPIVFLLSTLFSFLLSHFVIKPFPRYTAISIGAISLSLLIFGLFL